MTEPTVPTCYNCMAFSVCRYTPAGPGNPTRQPPFKSDEHVSPFLMSVAVIYAQACMHYQEEILP